MRASRALLLAPIVVSACVYGDAPKGRAVSELRDLDTEEAAFVTLINNYRASMGVGPLVATRLLNQVAYDHSLDMGTRRFFDHTNPDGLSPFDRMARAGYSGGRAENIAAGNGDARATFEQWRTSAGHNRNMLDASFRAMGIGRAYVASSTYRYYWTNVFGAVVDSSAITGSTPSTPPPAACVSGLAGSGTNGGSGARCLAQYTFNVEAGRTYTISTCGRSTGDTFLVVTGACACSNDDACDVGSECTCTASATGVAVLCASTYAAQTASWSYAVTATNGGRCSLAGAAAPDAGTARDASATPPVDAGAVVDVRVATDVTQPSDVRAATDAPAAYDVIWTAEASVRPDVSAVDVTAPSDDAEPPLDDAGVDAEKPISEVVITASPGCSTAPRGARASGLSLVALALFATRVRRRRHEAPRG